MSEARALLGPEVDRDALDEAADALGWVLVNIHPRSELAPRQLFFATPDGEGLVTCVEDHRIAARYLVVSAHDPEGVLDAVGTHLAEWTRADLLRLMPSDRVRATAWLGVARPTERDPGIAALLDEADRDPDPDVRAASAFAREALGW